MDTFTTNFKKTILLTILLTALLFGSQLLTPNEASAASGWQSVSDKSGKWVPQPPTGGEAEWFWAHARVEGPVSVAPGETFQVELYAWCTGDDYSPNPTLGASLEPDGTSPTFEDFCPSGTATLVETRNITAPIADGPVSLNLFPYVNCGGGCTTFTANDPAVYTYTVVSPCTGEWEARPAPATCSDQWPAGGNCYNILQSGPAVYPGSFGAGKLNCDGQGPGSWPPSVGGPCDTVGYQCQYAEEAVGNNQPESWRCVACGSAPLAPAMDISDDTLDFGDTDITGPGTDRTFTVTNIGGGTLTIDANPTISDGPFVSNYECFSASCSSGQSLNGGESVTYTVRYDPDTVSDNQTATLSLTGTISNTVSLTGNGVSSWCWDREIYSELAGDDPWQFCGPPQAACDAIGYCTDIAGFPPNGPADGEPYTGGPDKCVGVAPNGNSGSTAGNHAFCGGPVTPSPEAWFSNPNAPIGGPDVTVSVAYNDTLDLTWTSTDADPASCEVRDIGNTITWSGEPNTGTINSGVLTADTSFTVRCENGTGWSPNSPDILADVAAPLPPPTITFTSAPANPIDYDTSATLTWITTGADVCVATQGMAAGFDTLNNTNDSDSTVNLTADTTFEIECGNLSASSTAQLTVTVGAPPPTLSFDVNNITTGTSYGDGDTLTIDPSDEVEVTWSTTNVDSCLGTSGLPSVTSVGGYNVAEPADGDTTLYTLVCDASDGSTIDAEFTIRTRIANLNVSIIDFTPSAGFDDVLGEYDWVDVEIGVLSNGDLIEPLDVDGLFTVEVAIDKTGGGTTYDPPESYDINGLDYGDTDYEDVRFFDVPFTNATDPWFRAQVDTPLPGGSIVESDEDLADNQSETDFSPPLPPLNMTLDIDPSILVRGGSSVEISWDTTATFNMDCSLQGPGLQPDNPHTFNPSVPADGPTGTLTAGPITAKSGYTLTCDVPGVGTPQDYVATSSVETTGTVEEI